MKEFELRTKYFKTRVWHTFFLDNIAEFWLSILEPGWWMSVGGGVKPVDLAGADAKVSDYAEEVTERYNQLLVRWTGNVAVASVANIVTNFRELTPLPHADKRGRTAIVVQAERYRTGFGFVFEVDGGTRPSRGILKVNATLPVHEPKLSMLTHSAKQLHRVKLRTERYERLHQVDQVTSILGETLDLQ